MKKLLILLIGLLTVGLPAVAMDPSDLEEIESLFAGIDEQKLAIDSDLGDDLGDIGNLLDARDENVLTELSKGETKPSKPKPGKIRTYDLNTEDFSAYFRATSDNAEKTADEINKAFKNTEASKQQPTKIILLNRDWTLKANITPKNKPKITHPQSAIFGKQPKRSS